MVTTAHTGITLVEQAQAQKEVTVNEALKRIDALLNCGAVSATSTTPSATPSEGDVYIVAPNATDDWAGQDNNIAYYDQIWRFIPPKSGSTLWVQDVAGLYYFNGTAWDITTSSGGGSNTSAPQFGINSTADTTNRLSVRSEAALFTAESQDIRTIINKTDSTDTASHLFQQGFTGHAEFGLLGSNNFSLKVSDDGSQFTESFAVDRTNGNIAFNGEVSAPNTARRQHHFIEATQLLPTLTDGCSTLMQAAQSTNQPDLFARHFDANIIQHAECSMTLPQNWDGGDLRVQLFWTHGVTSTSGKVVWSIKALSRSDGNTLANNYGSTISQSDGSSAEDRLYISPETAPIIPSGGAQAGDLVFFRISRNATHSSDTLDSDAKLFGIRLLYGVNGLDNA